FQHLHRPAGPLDFDFLHGFRLAQPEVYPVMAGRSVADGARHLVVLLMVAGAVSGDEPNPRADAVAVAARPFEAQRNPVVALGAREADAARESRVRKEALALVAEQGKSLAGERGDDEVRQAVVVVVAEIDPHARNGPAVVCQAHASGQSDFLERSVAAIVK